MTDNTQAGNRMAFDDKFFVQLLTTLLIAAVCGWTALIYNQEQSTAAALAAHLKDVSDKAPLYVRKDDLGEINRRLQRIEDKLDNSVEKPR